MRQVHWIDSTTRKEKGALHKNRLRPKARQKCAADLFRRRTTPLHAIPRRARIMKLQPDMESSDNPDKNHESGESGTSSILRMIVGKLPVMFGGNNFKKTYTNESTGGELPAPLIRTAIHQGKEPIHHSFSKFILCFLVGVILLLNLLCNQRM